jgi:CheY-like chemotaxis protein
MLGETVEIETVLASDRCPAMVDAAQLETAILALAANARDAMLNGGRLMIRTAQVGPESDDTGDHRLRGVHATLTIEDPGVGMSAEVLRRCFDPFFSTKEVGKGIGLGLSMVDGFVRQSGGRLEVESTPGRGTVFVLHLPGLSADDELVDVDGPADDGAATDEGTILVVEDDRDVRESTVGLPRSLGYATLAAADAESALGLLEETPDVALLFSDLVLASGGGGADIARRARRRRPGLKILFTTGHSAKVTTRHGRLEDGTNLIQKPYRKADLARKVTAALLP